MVVVRIVAKRVPKVIFMLKRTIKGDWEHIFLVCRKFSVALLSALELSLSLFKEALVCITKSINLGLLGFGRHHSHANALWGWVGFKAVLLFRYRLLNRFPHGKCLSIDVRGFWWLLITADQRFVRTIFLRSVDNLGLLCRHLCDFARGLLIKCD